MGDQLVAYHRDRLATLQDGVSLRVNEGGVGS
jgi:hypothetical protein